MKIGVNVLITMSDRFAQPGIVEDILPTGIVLKCHTSSKNKSGVVLFIPFTSIYCAEIR